MKMSLTRFFRRGSKPTVPLQVKRIRRPGESRNFECGACGSMGILYVNGDDNIVCFRCA